ncbi:MAG: sarcosine oxidase subunit gamma family protein [Rhodospirillales bacterium]|jgi:sarcosine oxidase subunit gamma|nr:sarcosine oxidase subunit gamma family protein [Rhodospirillales bacterium]MDP6773934.1 sarcosine oxidase subunit gamma family protein [Rhodospirillales bacterium]
MLERRSALAAIYRVGRIGAGDGPPSLSVHERLARDLVQVSGWPQSFPSQCRRLETMLDFPMPDDGLKAVSHGESTIFRVGPERLWLAGPWPGLDPASPGDEAVVTDIGHSRTVLRVAGPQSRVLLNRGLPIDLDEAAFPAGSFAQSVIHHMAVLVHHLDGQDEAVFDVYVPRDFAVSFWQWLTEAAEAFGCQIEEPG